MKLTLQKDWYLFILENEDITWKERIATDYNNDFIVAISPETQELVRKSSFPSVT